jgi:CheY-like chemotaxis protein/HPt (histidine-containing phosphotransfer) domain-containing protein
VLVVDDHSVNREILEHHMTAGGMRCACAADGYVALEMLREAHQQGDAFDIAVIDMKMPGMDGLELAAAVRRDPVLSELRLVLVTSLHSTDELARAHELHMGAYLSKPVKRQDLFRALAQTVAEAPIDAPTPLPNRRAVLPTFNARVLLAEDNAVNQIVARKMLEALDCEYDIVQNGQEALKAALHERYDIVLMDCQMPVMDGYAASRAIREHEATNAAAGRLPIIALTANALVGDKEQCLAAGMDDHLAKPYSREQLALMLAQWLPAELVVHSAAAADADDGACRAESDSDVGSLDQGALDNIRAIDDDGTVLKQVIEMFLNDAPEQLAALRRALAGDDAVELERIAHSMKSASFNVGARALGELCRSLERHSKAGKTTGAADLVAGIEARLETVRPLLRAEMSQPA